MIFIVIVCVYLTYFVCDLIHLWFFFVLALLVVVVVVVIVVVVDVV